MSDYPLGESVQHALGALHYGALFLEACALDGISGQDRDEYRQVAHVLLAARDRLFAAWFADVSAPPPEDE